MKRQFFVILSVIMLCLFAVYGTGQCFAEGSGKGQTPVNKVCPVMGIQINEDTPFRTEYNGEVIGFACAGCPEAFLANPEKFADKLKKEQQ